LNTEWREDLGPLFQPETIAFIGASKSISKWGNIILSNILIGEFKGVVHPINPKEEWILGLKVHRSVLDIEGPVDLAMIVTPAKLAPDILKDCAKKGVKSAIVVPGGFSEEGEAGAALEKELARVAEAAGIRLVGPNTMGIFSGKKSLYALMPPVRPKPGPVAFVAQSGNLGTQLMSIGQEHEIGFSGFAASGNEAVLHCEDYLRYFGEDPDTKVVMAYIEGLDNGRSFIDIAKKVSREKPLVVFKGGITAAGMKAASSHTGALAGSEEIFNAAFRQTGAIRAANPKQMLDLAWALSELPLPRTNRVGVLTWGGGWGVVTADCCEKAGLEVAPLSKKTIEKIDKLLPPYWSRGNPIDLVGTLDRHNHIACLEALIADENVDSAIVLGVVGGATLITAQMETMQGAPAAVTAFVEAFEQMDRMIEEKMLELIDKYNKPIIGVALYESYRPYKTGKGRMIVLQEPHKAVNVLEQMFKYRQYLESIGVER